MTAGKRRLINEGYIFDSFWCHSHKKGRLVNDSHLFDSFWGHSHTSTAPWNQGFIKYTAMTFTATNIRSLLLCTPQGTQDLIDNTDWAADAQVWSLTYFMFLLKLIQVTSISTCLTVKWTSHRQEYCYKLIYIDHWQYENCDILVISFWHFSLPYSFHFHLGLWNIYLTSYRWVDF